MKNILEIIIMGVDIECNNQFQMPNINNNILPKGNNINIDILSEIRMA